MWLFVSLLPGKDDKCFAIGWGRTEGENGPVADTLQEVDVPIKAKCPHKFSNDSFQVCGGYDEGGKDTCSGKPSIDHFATFMRMKINKKKHIKIAT